MSCQPTGAWHHLYPETISLSVVMMVTSKWSWLQLGKQNFQGQYCLCTAPATVTMGSPQKGPVASHTHVTVLQCLLPTALETLHWGPKLAWIGHEVLLCLQEKAAEEEASSPLEWRGKPCNSGHPWVCWYWVPHYAQGDMFIGTGTRI